MREITCDEVFALLDEALAQIAGDWRAVSGAAPDDYPERMTIADWSRRHIGCTLLPELLQLRVVQRPSARQAATSQA